MDASIVRADELETHAHDWGEVTFYASDTVGKAKEVSFGQCVIRPGEALPKHYHPNCSEVIHLAQGVITHTMSGDETTRMEAGDTIIVPRNMPHQARNVGEEDAVLLIVFSAAHREFVPVS